MDRYRLTAAERHRLERQLHDTRDARVYRRTLAVLEVSRGAAVADVAQALGVTRQSVYHWLAEYGSSHDPQALVDAARSGRPSRWRSSLQQVLRSTLETLPGRWGYWASSWTVPLLCQHLERHAGQRLSEDTVRRELGRLGYVWKRCRYVLGPDPDAEKKRHIRRTIAHLPPRSVVLAEDETNLLLFPPLRASWAQRGEPAPVPITGRNARRVVFGALNLRTG
jgi:transposase